MKKICAIVLACCIALPVIGTPVLAAGPVQAVLTESLISVDDLGYPFLRLRGYNIEGRTYFRLRDLALIFDGSPSQFDVAWNGKENAVEIITGRPYSSPGSYDGYYPWNKVSTAKPATSKIVINGEVRQVKAYEIDGSTFLQLRELGQHIPFEVIYDGERDEIRLYSRLPDNAYRVHVTPAVIFNQLKWKFPRWKTPVTSYLVANGDQTLSVIEAGSSISIETYDLQFRLLARKTIEPELPLFGGFFSGEKYNYIAFGQENREQNDNKEVIRIVRYDKQFNRIDSVSVKGGESFTVVPFHAGSGRMAEHGDTLVFHTARLRYKTPDGLNHQSQLTIVVDTSTMTVTNHLGRFQENHVSHSFDQYVLFDGNRHVLLDHGDAYPRSIVLSRQSGNSYNTVSMFDIPGKIGANMTGVSVGGFEMSSTSYIVAMNTVDHSLVQEYTDTEMVGLPMDQRDIILSVVPRNNLSPQAVTQRTIAKYAGTDNIASIPHLVKVSDNRFLVMWQEYDSYGRSSLKYVTVDQDGVPIGSIRSLDHFWLSECKPIVADGKVIWYANFLQSRIFYTIPL